jgi:hypothetical protein
MQEKNKNILSFSLAGVISYVLTDIIHEVLGHGLTCLTLGHKITLLTSVYFRSYPNSFITDIGGPISNLVVALLLLAIISREKNQLPFTRFLLLLIMSFNFFWFSGTVLQSGFSKIGDWTYAVKQLPIGTHEKTFLLVAGILLYYAAIKLVGMKFRQFNSNAPDFPLKQSIIYAYFAAAIAAIIAGLLFSPNRIIAAWEGLLEVIASVPLLLIGLRLKTSFNSYETRSTFVFNIIAICLFIIFCLTLGRGIIPH